MKVNVNMTINVSDEDRRAVRWRFGERGLADHAEVLLYLRAYLRGAISDLDSPPDEADEK